MIRIPFFGAPGDAAGGQQPAQSSREAKAAAAKPAAAHPLDELTGGAFSAATSGERAARVRAWLATGPDVAAMQEVYKELSLRDKGAARALREKLDEIKRSKEQEVLVVEWAAKAEILLQAGRLNIADAMAWQRDAAKAGAPLSKEPLLTFKSRLASSIQSIEDLQMRAQVQREAAVLLAQRIELLSARSWKDADAAQAGLQADVAHWHEQTRALQQDANWGNVEPRHAGQLESANQQLDLVAQAFADVLTQARAASDDVSKPLPPVQIWADELRAGRGETVAAVATQQGAADEAGRHVAEKTPAQTAARQQEAREAVQPLVQALDRELGSGHGKNAAAAAQAVRNAMKVHARFLEASLETQVQAALSRAGELEGWQRWRADQLRTELVQKAEALIHRKSAPESAGVPAPEMDGKITGPEATAVPPAAGSQKNADPAGDVATETAADAPFLQEQAQRGMQAQATEAGAAAGELPTSPHSPRKLQELLRQLREQWKEMDQGGMPNHALWRRFDQACNEAYRIVQAWLTGIKQHAAEQKTLRLSLLAEVKEWGERLSSLAQEGAADWKAAQRELGEFSRRWREAGHVSEKIFAELQPQWKAVLQEASKPLEQAQQSSIAARQQMIAEAAAQASGPLRIDAVKELQQRWQQESQRVPLERRQEQKLWEAFRKPIDEAFQRKSQQREQLAAVFSQRDRSVLDAAHALETAIAGGDAQVIRSAMQALEAAMRSQETAAAAPADAQAGSGAAISVQTVGVDDAADRGVSAIAAEDADPDAVASEQEAPVTPVRAAPRPVVAMRGDDRPGARPAPLSGDKRGARGEQDARRGPRDGSREPRRDNRHSRDDSRKAERAPRIGDAAFRAQRDAMEHAQSVLRKISLQAHDETLAHLLVAWEQRNSEILPPASAWGKSVGSNPRALWAMALTGGATVPGVPPAEALLRLEMAAGVPTPAQHLDARRTLQLQLLTRRNDPAPAQTWAEDVARVLASPFDAEFAKRLKGVLRVLLK